MKFYARIIEDNLEMSPEQNRLWKQFLSTFTPTDLAEIEIKKYRQPRSHKQLGAWWGLYNKTVLAEFNIRGWDTSYIFKLDQPTGIEITADLLKEYMYAMCPSYNDDGGRITMRKMDTVKMAKFLDDCRNFAASQWSIYVPEPDKNYKKNAYPQEEQE